MAQESVERKYSEEGATVSSEKTTVHGWLFLNMAFWSGVQVRKWSSTLVKSAPRPVYGTLQDTISDWQVELAEILLEQFRPGMTSRLVEEARKLPPIEEDCWQTEMYFF